jgi:hypothetical protein
MVNLIDSSIRITNEIYHERNGGRQSGTLNSSDMRWIVSTRRGPVLRQKLAQDLSWSQSFKKPELFIVWKNQYKILWERKVVHGTYYPVLKTRAIRKTLIFPKKYFSRDQANSHKKFLYHNSEPSLLSKSGVTIDQLFVWSAENKVTSTSEYYFLCLCVCYCCLYSTADHRKSSETN